MHTTQTFDRARSASRVAPRQILLAAVISFVLSVCLWFTGHENQGIFVGLWVPSILSFGALMLAGSEVAGRE